MAAFVLLRRGQGAVREPRGKGDALGGSSHGPLFLLGSSCGPRLEEPSLQAVGLMAMAPPCPGPAASGGAGAALPGVAMEGPV